MTVMIREGRTYVARNGEKFGPMRRAKDHEFNSEWPWTVDGRKAWKTNGSYSTVRPVCDLDLIAEWTDGPVFTVGAKVRRIDSPHSFVPIGYETDIKGIEGNTLSYRDADGDLMHSPVEHWELVERTDGPVRTVTRREVVEGVYAHVAVCPHEPGSVLVGFAHPHDQHFRAMTPAELKAAAAVLLELAGALEE